MTLKNNEQIEDLMCPICKNKRIIINTINNQSWRAQCEDHIWVCHVKTNHYTKIENAVKAAKRLVKGLYRSCSQEELFGAMLDEPINYPDIKSLCLSCKFEPHECEAQYEDVTFFEDWDIISKCKFYKEKK